MPYPVIAGYKLTSVELELTRLWLSSASHAGLREIKAVAPREFTNGLNFLPRAGLDDLREILQWCRPLLIINGSQADAADDQAFFEMGAGAFMTLPCFDEPMLFPNPALPEVQGTVFVVTDDPRLRSLYRQLFRFAGYEIRVDFRAADEIAETLEHMHTSASEDTRLPALILLDLDSARVDPVTFFHYLKTWTRDNPRAKAALRVMVTRDFARPGGDIAGLAGAMRPFVRRIFHPYEALCALMEAFLFHGHSADPGPTKYRGPEYRPLEYRPLEYPTVEYRNLAALLHGSDGRPAARSPRETLDFARDKIAHAKRALPFLRLHDYLNRDSVREGAVLAPQPGVDAGNLLHGISSPHTAGKTVEHASE